MNREFHAEKPNEKWLTDVTEFKYYEGPRVKKVYLSAILDLYDRRIVSFVIRDTNDNKLVFDTFAKAVQRNPDAHPIFHSDRGFQYTNRYFNQWLVDVKAKAVPQSDLDDLAKLHKLPLFIRSACTEHPERVLNPL